MANRTQIVCLHEGAKGRSIDPLFINSLIKKLKPSWIRPWEGSNIIRTIDGGGRKELMEKMPRELKIVLNRGGNTTLMVWADLDDDMPNALALRKAFWRVAEAAGITTEEFEQVVFLFAKDRLENWIEFLETGSTDEAKEGPRVKHNREVRDAARRLADRCLGAESGPPLPKSLQWSCGNWSRLVRRMSAS